MNRTMKKIFTLFLILSSFLILSCEVGLGEAIDLIAPSVNISTPVPTGSVTQTFTIKGNAQDNFGVIQIDVNVIGDGVDLQYQWTSGGWKIKNGTSWDDYEDGTVNGSQKNMDWTLTVPASTALSGHDYTITTVVADYYGNEGKNTKDERVVTIDTSEPTVSIIEPILSTSATDSAFASYALKDNNVLNRLHNGTFTISGSQREDTHLDYLMVYLDEDTTPLTRTNVEYSGTYIAKKKVTGDNLRNWSTEISLSELPSTYNTEKHIVRLVTESHDQAGNIETKSNGWFVYWNEADIPWVNATFGSGVSSSPIEVYPSCSLQGQAYDDDGLKSISIQVFDDTGAKVQDYSIGEAELREDGNPTYKAWAINALGETCRFSVKVKCTDIYNNTSEEVTRYLSVSDVNPPQLYNISPASGSIELGNSNGQFTFSGKVKDDGEIDFVKIVRIADGKDSTQMQYFDKSYSEWNKATTNGYTDVNGNKIWTLPLSAENIEGNYHIRTITKSFNYFSDFGISATGQKSTNQKFILLTQDKGGSSSVESYTLQIDVVAPSIAVTTIKVYASGASTPRETQEFGNEPITLTTPFTRSGESITDKIEITGTWSDNSSDMWGASKIGTPVIKVGGNSVSCTKNSNGTWTTGKINPPDSATGVISASLTDWAGNTTNTSASYYVNSSVPVLSRIGAISADGSYKQGDKIQITMEFNKAVTFTGVQPVLTLNTGKTAIYESGNTTSKHVFTYLVGAGENVEKLGVVNINSGITWTDNDGSTIELVGEKIVLPTGTTSLQGGRSIRIDTTPPSLQSITPITSPGYYNANKEIFIQAKFSESVKFSDISKLKLNFNNGKTSTTTTKTGSDTVLFKYQVGPTDNAANPLSISSITSSGCTITDIAGNSIGSTITVPNNLGTGTKGIYIDTQAPATPVIQGLGTQSVVYGTSGISFSLAGLEEGITYKKYTVDGGKSWLDYTSTVTLTTNGEYNICAYQEDLAGNRSEYTTTVTRILDSGEILTFVTADVSDGVYTTGNKIPIKLNFRKNVTVSAASKLKLNVTGVEDRYAVYKSGSGSSVITYEYTVQEHDACDRLEITDFNYVSIKDSDNIDLSSYCTLPAAGSGNRLEDSRTISIVTGIPVISNFVFNQTETTPRLEITFNRKITKLAGKSITITNTNYLAPAVLTKAQYLDYYGTSSSIATYYEKGVNGASSSEVADTSEKYVLKFNYDSNTAALKTLMTGTIKADVITIPISSSKVSIGSDSKTMYISLSDAYKLPVKGTSYSVTIPEGIVADDQNHTNQADTTSRTFTLNGVEAPVIRVNKAKETISGDKATQPATASVKMDCQTPGANIKYTMKTSTYATNTVTESVVKNTGNGSIITSVNPVVTNGSEANYTSSFTIGSSSDLEKGYKYFIDAYTTYSSTKYHAYEVAVRSVVRIKYGSISLTTSQSGGYTNPENCTSMWIRGGDAESGGVATPGFPFSWNPGEYNKARLMTKTSDNKYWYWITWDISTSAYFGFLAGNVPNDAATNGPSNWVWASCSWVSSKAKYPLKPGESISMDPTMDFSAWLGTGQFQFFVKHCQYRVGGPGGKCSPTYGEPY